MRSRDVYRLQREQNSFQLLHSPPYNGNYLLRQSGCPRKPDSLGLKEDLEDDDWCLTLHRIVILTSHRCRGQRPSAGGAHKRSYAGHPSQNIRSAHDSLSSRPLCKCERSSLCVHLPVWTLIYLHIYTCRRPLWWCSALRGGHMLPLLSQTKTLNPSDTPASASRPSVTSVMPLAHCCSLLSPHFNAVWTFAKLYSFLTGYFLLWGLIK